MGGRAARELEDTSSSGVGGDGWPCTPYAFWCEAGSWGRPPCLASLRPDYSPLLLPGRHSCLPAVLEGQGAAVLSAQQGGMAWLLFPQRPGPGSERARVSKEVTWPSPVCR